MRVLVVDVGGTRVKVLATGEKAPREFASGPTLTAEQMVAGVRTAAAGWKYDAVSIGYPGPVLHGRPVAEPHNLGPGWVGFDYRTAFERPVKLVHDAAMQARGIVDRKSTRLNSSHDQISYAVFCLKKKNILSKRHR